MQSCSEHAPAQPGALPGLGWRPAALPPALACQGLPALALCLLFQPSERVSQVAIKTITYLVSTSEHSLPSVAERSSGVGLRMWQQLCVQVLAKFGVGSTTYSWTCLV